MKFREGSVFTHVCLAIGSIYPSMHLERGVIPCGVDRGCTPAPVMATEAAGLHPNGIHSCLIMSQVNNAGATQLKAIPDLTSEDLDQMLDLHVKGPFNITQRALPAITKSKGERV